LSDLEELRRRAEAAKAPLPAAVPPAVGKVWLTEGEVAALLKISKGGLSAMRARGGGPPFIRIGKRIRYDASRLTEKRDPNEPTEWGKK